MYTYQGRGCVHIKVMAEIPKTTTTNGAKTLGWYKLPNLNWCRSTSINSVFFHRYIMGAGIGGKKSWSPNGWITSKILKMIHDLKSIDQKPFTQMLEPRISDFWSATQNRKTGSRFEVPPITYICLFESSLVSKIGCFFWEWELQVPRIHGFSKWWRVNYSDTPRNLRTKMSTFNICLQEIVYHEMF